SVLARQRRLGEEAAMRAVKEGLQMEFRPIAKRPKRTSKATAALLFGVLVCGCGGESTSSATTHLSEACRTDIKTLQTAVDAYVNDHSGPGALQPGDMTRGDITVLVGEGYIHSFSAASSCPSLTLMSAQGGFTVSGT